VSAWRGPLLVVGHRGGRGPGWPPENTLEAFEQAREQGARAIELDVRTSSDGAAVVFHDRDLARMTAARDVRRVEEVPLSALRSIDLGAGARIPTLADALAWGRDRDVAVNVELKYDVPSRRRLAQAALRDLGGCAGDVLVSSFDPILLAMSAALAPRRPRAFITHAAQPRWADALEGLSAPPALAAMHLERVQASVAKVGRYGRRGLRVGAWTVNDAAEAVALARLGVASIITDRPGAVRDALDGARDRRASA
jgi:glycerophosphoryl diester phosphodiesterase